MRAALTIPYHHGANIFFETFLVDFDRETERVLTRKGEKVHTTCWPHEVWEGQDHARDLGAERFLIIWGPLPEADLTEDGWWLRHDVWQVGGGSDEPFDPSLETWEFIVRRGSMWWKPCCVVLAEREQAQEAFPDPNLLKEASNFYYDDSGGDKPLR